MTTSIFEKILYGIKVANDNIIVLNDKVDLLMKTLSYEETDPAGVGSEHEEIDTNNLSC